MKHLPVYALLMFVFYSSCKGQNKTVTKDVITFHGPNSITRTMKQDRKGNIWIASWEGIFGTMENLLPMLQVK